MTIAPRHHRRATLARYAGFAALTAALVILAAAWQWSPLKDRVDLAALLELMRRIQDLPLAPLAVLGAYVVASLAAIPMTLVVLVTGAVFEPVPAIAYALGGILLGAAASFLAGAWLGRDAVRRLAGARINRVSRRMAKGGITAVALMRLFPLAPFTVVNVVAGASHIRLRDFLLGTLIGEGPFAVLIVLCAHQLSGAIREPSAAAFAGVAAALGLLVALGCFVKRRFARA